MGGAAEYLIGANGDIYPLTDLGLELTGMGDIPVEYQATAGYMQHGSTVRSWRLTPRTLSFQWRHDVRRKNTLPDVRAELLDVLNPEAGMVTYQRVLSSGQRRNIDGWLQGGLSLADAGDGSGFDIEMALECPDPVFYDPTQQTVVLAGGYSKALAFPMAFGVSGDDAFWFDSPTIARSTITYTGNWRSYPVITISGPYTSVTVRNHTTGASFTLSVAIGSGETVIVDLTPGALSIVDGLGNSLLSHRTGGTFTGWYLQPGDNDILVTGSGTSLLTTFTLTYFRRFIAL